MNITELARKCAKQNNLDGSKTACMVRVKDPNGNSNVIFVAYYEDVLKECNNNKKIAFQTLDLLRQLTVANYNAQFNR